MFLSGIFPSYYILSFLLASAVILSFLLTFFWLPLASIVSLLLSPYLIYFISFISFLASPSALGPWISGLPGSPVRFLPPYFLQQKLTQERVRHDARCFVVLLDYPGYLLILYDNHARDTVAGAWRKRGSIPEGERYF